MPTARLFKSGNSQAVRLPKEFRLEGPDVEIFRRGEEIVLREKRRGLAHLLDLIAQLPPEIEQREDAPPQERPGLDEFFDGPVVSGSPRPHRRKRASK